MEKEIISPIEPRKAGRYPLLLRKDCHIRKKMYLCTNKTNYLVTTKIDINSRIY